MAKKSMKKFHFLFHLVAYYSAWFSCMTLAAHGYTWVSTAVVVMCVLMQMLWQFKVQHHTSGLLFLLAIMVIASTLIDSLLLFSGVIIYAANPFSPYVTPPWMIATWISFTVILYATLSSLFNRLMLLGALSFFGFTLAFAMGAKMGAAFFPYGYKTSFLIGGIWFIMLPTLMCLYKKLTANLA